MRKKDLGKMILVFLIIVIAIIQYPTEAAPPESDGFLPSITSLTPEAGVEPKYEIYPWTNYTFDVEKGKGFIDFNEILNILPNIVFLPLVLLTKFTTFMLVSCYKVNIFDIMPGVINEIVWAVRNGVFYSFYEIVVAMAGVYGIIKTYYGAKTTGFTITLSTVIVFALATWFFHNPSALANGFNKGVEAISTQVLFEVTQVADPKNSSKIKSGDDSIVLMANMFWDVAVMKPYEVIQYGSINPENKVEKFLEKDPGSEERKTLANEKAEKNKFFRGALIPARFVYALISLLVGIVYNGCMLLIAGTIAFNHFGSLYWLCFAGLFFLAALYPKHGLKSLSRWALETFGHLLKRLIITIGLSIYFAISMAIYTSAGKYGYLGIMFFNIVLLIYAIVNHQKVFEMILGMFLGNPAMVNSGMQRESMGGKLAKLAATAYVGKKVFSNAKNSIERSRVKSFEKKNKDKAISVLTDRYRQDKLGARKNAEAMLNQRYQQEIKEAENRAKETGRPPEYSKFVQEAQARQKNKQPMWTEEQIDQNTKDTDFVKQVDSRKAKGFTLFSDDQVKSQLHSMYKLKKEGNDPDRLLYTSVENKTEDQIQYTQDKKDFTIAATNYGLEADKEENNEKIEDHIESKPGPHFKMKSAIKSHVRRGIKAIGESSMDKTAQSVPEHKIELPEANKGELVKNETKLINPESINEKIMTDIETERSTSIKVKNTVDSQEAVTNKDHLDKQVNHTTNTSEIRSSTENKLIEGNAINNTIEKHTHVENNSLNKTTETNSNKVETVTNNENKKTEVKKDINITESQSTTENKRIESNEINNTIEKQTNVENHTVNKTHETTRNTNKIETQIINETLNEPKIVEHNVEAFMNAGARGNNSAPELKMSDIALMSQVFTSKKRKKESQEQAEAMRSIMEKLKKQGSNTENTDPE